MAQQRSLLLHLILLTASIKHGDCELFSISNTSYPHIFITDPVNVPVVWHRKLLGFRSVQKHQLPRTHTHTKPTD